MIAMQRKRWKLVACMFVACISAAVAQDSDWYCPPVPALPDKGTPWEKWFIGSIGGAPARMHLLGGGSVAKGEFYLLADWKPVIVGGKLQPDGELLLHDEQDSRCGVDNECAGPSLLHARLRGAAMTGTWKALPADQDKSIDMHAEAAPKCEVGKAKSTFRNPPWPITFAYPAAWHIVRNSSTVSLLCPDPARMAYQGWNITLEMGDLGPGGKLPDDPRLNDFTKDSKGTWQYTSPLGGGTDPTIVKQQNSLMIVRARQASRRGYCTVGGYSGLTDEEVALILSNGNWILVNGGPKTSDVINLILNTAAP